MLSLCRSLARPGSLAYRAYATLSLPPCVPDSRHATPWVSAEEHAQYLPPLQMAGWTVQTLEPTNGSDNLDTIPSYEQLTLRLKARSFSRFMRVVGIVNEVANAENVRPRLARPLFNLRGAFSRAYLSSCISSVLMTQSSASS